MTVFIPHDDGLIPSIPHAALALSEPSEADALNEVTE